MSNKLKTLSASQLEHLISEAVGEYIGDECSCKVSELDTPEFDTEANIGLHDKRNMNFKVFLSYSD